MSTRNKDKGTLERQERQGGAVSSQSDIDAFLRQVRARPAQAPSEKPGRLVFAMDATASREPSWDRACQIQGEMFSETSALGGLSVQLAYYRGFGEFKASPWLTETAKLLREMTGVFCLGGQTQIGRLLKHVIAETKKERVQAVVFVGDAFEEDIDAVCYQAGELGVLGVPVFVFHEGGDPLARRAFEQIARLTKGACCPFDGSSAQQLRDLLGAVAVYAAGGRKALQNFSERRGGAALQLTHRFGR
ncbi:VWA domain-containing protein [Nisaea acidiphila]|uniref:VWA domain-containing protein n=1 Tax=Nisaea acidiphila TaxID=1862145 RepID=A0A9J7AQH9_9PROT|nr:VWA domain-containing protein [Nisaea acidiphila]UUX49146.1 VWA domain-containing protein [Nisaea acidiphila]